jgi:hypothetical protein
MEKKNVDLLGVTGVDTTTETADNRFESAAEEVIFFEVNEDATMIGIESVVERFVAAEDNSVK